MQPSRGARLFRLLTRLLPGEFRGDFADAMAADVDGGGPRGAGFWTREIAALLRAVVREHADALRQDVTYGLRMMRRTPGFTAVAVLMLALGTGANVAIFSIVDAVLIRSPFGNASEIVSVRVIDQGQPTMAVPPDRYRELQQASTPLASVASFGNGGFVLTGQGDPQNVDDIECFDAAMFDVLRTRPLLGRVFGPADDRPTAAPTIVLSHFFWRQLGGSQDLLGRTITLNQTPVTVIGVMPPGFAGPLARGDVQGWVPPSPPIRDASSPGCRGGVVNVIARMRPGLSRGTANAAMPPGYDLQPLESPITQDVRTPFLVLMAAVTCVLLITCLNVGGLQMERSLARRRELALRLALGATRGRLVRQTLTENLLLAFGGATAGIAVAALTLDLVVSMLPGNVPYLDQIAVSRRVLAFAIAMATGAGLIAGLLPLAESRRVTPARDLTDVTRASERRGSFGRRALVVAEIALSIVVLIGAALMIQTFLTLRPNDPGFDPARKQIMSVRLRGATPAQAAPFFGLLLDRLRATSGIRGAEGSTTVPLVGGTRLSSIPIGDRTARVWTNSATPGYFSLLDISIVAGRAFTAADSIGTEPVLMVNEYLASRLRPGGQVVGELIALQHQGDRVPIERRVVGVFANVRTSTIDTRPRPEAYYPYAQKPDASQWIVAEAEPGREAEAGAAMRAALRTLRPDLAISAPRSLAARVSERFATPRFGAWALGLLAALAVTLAAIGLTATIAWWVRQRTREIGVRVALGATRGGVTALVLRQGLTLAALGVATGCAAAAVVTRYLEGWIYGVTPLDATTFAGCAALMLAIAIAAVYVPVRRATAVDPVVALRAE